MNKKWYLSRWWEFHLPHPPAGAHLAQLGMCPDSLCATLTLSMQPELLVCIHNKVNQSDSQKN